MSSPRTRQHRIIDFLKRTKQWHSISEIDNELYSQGLKHARRTIARDLDILEKNSLIRKTREKNHILYQIENDAVDTINLSTKELENILYYLDQFPEDANAQKLLVRLKKTDNTA